MHTSVRQAGFSLIEILVGLVIGLLATLVIMQVFSVFEGQKRTTSGIADAQTNGSIALYTMTRELQQAGFGLLPVTDSALECAQPINIAISGVGDISPVTINDGGTAAGVNNSDTITVRYSSSDSAGIPAPITAIAGTTASVDNNMGCQGSNVVLIMRGNACAITSGSAVAATTTGVALDSTPAEAAIGANLACLGTWNEVTYRANAGNLERNTVPSIADIVNIQAQYGITDVANSNQITQWVDATGIWAAPTVANRNLIRAVRIAVVARNGLLEKVDVSTTCSGLTVDAPTGLCAWSGTSSATIPPSPAPALILSNDPDGTSWQRYRYRVFETIAPLRNMIWAAKETL